MNSDNGEKKARKQENDDKKKIEQYNNNQCSSYFEAGSREEIWDEGPGPPLLLPRAGAVEVWVRSRLQAILLPAAPCCWRCSRRGCRCCGISPSTSADAAHRQQLVHVGL